MTEPAAPVPSPQEPVDLQVESQAPTGGGPAHTEQLDPDQALNLLTRLLRATYPHPTFPDGPYERTAGAVMTAAEADQGDYRSLLLGLRGLDVAAGGDFAGTDDDAAEALLRNVGDDSFFVRIRSTAIVALYDDAEVWDLLGYEGPSFDQGGYVDRGFNDLDWLPPARIEEFADEPRVQHVSENGHLL